MDLDKYYKVELLNTTRLIHEDEFNENSYNRLIEELTGKDPVIWHNVLKGKDEYGIISTEIGRTVRVKFIKDLLGKLYTDNPWAETPDICFDSSRVKKLKYSDFYD